MRVAPLATTSAAIFAIALAVTAITPMPAAARSNLFEVHGVDAGDMLKMRAGPDTGYRVLLGLPNGTKLRVYKCESRAAVQWCKVSLQEFRAVVGWVSMSYLREAK